MENGRSFGKRKVDLGLFWSFKIFFLGFCCTSTSWVVVEWQGCSVVFRIPVVVVSCKGKCFVKFSKPWAMSRKSRQQGNFPLPHKPTSRNRLSWTTPWPMNESRIIRSPEVRKRLGIWCQDSGWLWYKLVTYKRGPDKFGFQGLLGVHQHLGDVDCFTNLNFQIIFGQNHKQQSAASCLLTGFFYLRIS